MTVSSESPVDGRLRRLVRRLRTSFDHKAAMRALAEADMSTLRVLECSLTGGRMRDLPEPELREWLAEQHVKMKRGKKLSSTRSVSARTVQRWALDILTVWFPGYTDFDDALGGQYKISYLGRHGSSGVVDKYEVSTLDGEDPKTFRVTIAVLADEPA